MSELDYHAMMSNTKLTYALDPSPRIGNTN